MRCKIIFCFEKIIFSNLPFLKTSTSLPFGGDFIGEEDGSPGVDESTHVEGVETNVETSPTLILKDLLCSIRQ